MFNSGVRQHNLKQLYDMISVKIKTYGINRPYCMNYRMSDDDTADDIAMTTYDCVGVILIIEHITVHHVQPTCTHLLTVHIQPTCTKDELIRVRLIENRNIFAPKYLCVVAKTPEPLTIQLLSCCVFIYCTHLLMFVQSFKSLSIKLFC